MQETSSVAISQIILFSTLALLGCVIFIVRNIFLNQRRKFHHLQEVLEIRETFNKTLLESKLKIQEQTLDHIGKELHANVSHLVSLININLSEMLPQSSPRIKDNIIETKSLTKQLMSELKGLSASLNTDYIMHVGFSNALKKELNRHQKRFNVSFTISGEEYGLPPESSIILFRLCQEIIDNVLKYAQAKSVTALLQYSPELFTLEIADDGIGFDVNQVLEHSVEKNSTGLINMRKRAKLIDADVRIDSQPGHGTRFTITIPPSIKQSTIHDNAY